MPKLYHPFEDLIWRKRRAISPPNVASKWTNDTLRILFENYDDLFFGRELSSLLLKAGKKLILRFNKNRAITDAGKTSVRSSSITISMPLVLFQKLDETKSYLINGIMCCTPGTCLQLAFEHELVHVLLDVLGYDGWGPIWGSHGYFFRVMAFVCFGHCDYQHHLLE